MAPIADPIASLPPYQFARDTFLGASNPTRTIDISLPSVSVSRPRAASISLDDEDLSGRRPCRVPDFRFAIQKIQNFRGREAAVESHKDSRLGKDIAQSFNQTAQNPMAPAEPGAFPGRNTAATKYCSASSLKVRKQTIGK
jgi:hypothetical protein